MRRKKNAVDPLVQIRNPKQRNELATVAWPCEQDRRIARAKEKHPPVNEQRLTSVGAVMVVENLSCRAPPKRVHRGSMLRPCTRMSVGERHLTTYHLLRCNPYIFFRARWGRAVLIMKTPRSSIITQAAANSRRGSGSLQKARLLTCTRKRLRPWEERSDGCSATLSITARLRPTCVLH